LAARGNSPDGRAALSELCAAYYGPVLAFVRSRGAPEDAARDLTHGFFARLLESQGIASVDPQRGRFRSFLLGAVKHFLADMRDHDNSAKRGGGIIFESLEPGTDTSPGLELADSKEPSPDQIFERKWALTILDRALATLANEFTAAGRSEQFEILKVWLTGDIDGISQREAAERMSMNEGAFKVAVHRLRRRFREVIKNEIRQTVNDEAQVNEELRHLLESLV